MGSKWRLDPRYGPQHLADLTLNLQFRSYQLQDPPPEKVKPIPLQLVQHACSHTATPLARAIGNMIIIGFYYLLRPGEYTYSSSNNHPFRLQDVTFITPRGQYNAATAPIAAIKRATRVLLLFTTQKNRTKDQPITHGDTTDPVLSPLKAVLRQVLLLRQHRAPPDTPLYTYYDAQTHPQHITAKLLTNTLKASARAVGSSVGVHPKDISVRALRNGGCVALIRAGVDPLVAKMMGRWRSWAMLEYLQIQSLETSGFAQRMLGHGFFQIPAHQTLPTDVLEKARPYIDAE